tara:strand:+ start:355 stop:1623 length:1269 start_codon:yes stop_codon:yes gene_type:complete
MKKSILNRPMFRQGKSPAYGTGISANLVSDDQRQKYNYGGRVGFANRGYAMPPWFDETWVVDPGLAYPAGVDPTRMKDWYTNIQMTDGVPEISKNYQKIYGDESPHGVAPEKTYNYRSTIPNQSDYLFKGSGEDQDIIERSVVEEIQPESDLVQKAKDAGFDDVESYQAAISDTEDMEGPFSNIQLKQAKKRVDEQFADQDKAEALTGEGTGAGTGVDDTTMLDMEGIIDKYYDKKGSLGKAQLGLAGQVLKAGFQKKSDAAGTIGDAVGAFGTSLQTDKDAMKKLAATGEIQRELYKTSRSQEGVEDRKTAKFKNALPKKENEAWSTSDRFDIGQAAAMKANLRGDDMLAYSVEYAMPGTSVKKLTGGADKTSLQKDAAAIQGGDENTLYIKDGKIWQKDSSGKLTIEVDFETIGLIKPQA